MVLTKYSYCDIRPEQPGWIDHKQAMVIIKTRVMRKILYRTGPRSDLAEFDSPYWAKAGLTAFTIILSSDGQKFLLRDYNLLINLIFLSLQVIIFNTIFSSSSYCK